MVSVHFRRLAPAPDPDLGAAPLPRSSHGLSALRDGRRLVLYGGEHAARTPIADARQALWLAERGTAPGAGWSWVSPRLVAGGGAPSARIAHAQASVGEAVYVFGGRGGVDIGETALRDVWRLELVEGTQGGAVAQWTEITPPASQAAPEARSFHKMIAVATDLYVFGGCGAAGRLNDLWKFDTLTTEWTALGCSHVLKGRGGPSLLSLSSGGAQDGAGATIAVVTGFAGEETNDGHVFRRNAWEARGMEGGLAALRKRSVCAFGSLPARDACLLFGGEVDPSTKGHEGAGGFADDLVVLDGTTGAVRETHRRPAGDGAAWPAARGWADAAVGGDALFLFGGLAGDDAAPVRLDDLWECRLARA